MRAGFFGGLACVALLGAVTPNIAPPAKTAELDLDKIFVCTGEDEASQASCAEAREIIMTTCQSCHNFARIVRGRHEPAEWAVIIERHRTRVAGSLTDEQLEAVERYLIENFRPGVPPPELPSALDEMG